MGIERPDHLAAVGGIGFEHAVEAARKDHPRNDRHGGRKPGIAGGFVLLRAVIPGGGVPERCAAERIEGEQPRFALPAEAADKIRIGIGHVEPLPVGRHAPVNAAGESAAADFPAPQQRAVIVRVEGVHHARFLTGQEDFAAILTAPEHGRGADIQIGAILFRAVAAIAAEKTAEIPRVAGQRLIAPADRAAVEVHGDHRVAVAVRRRGIGFSGAHVEQAARGIDGRAVPDRRAGRVQPRDVVGVALTGRTRRRRNTVGFPEDLALARGQRDHGAAKTATGVLRICGRRPLRGRQRHVHRASVHAGRAGDRGGGVLADPALPQQGAVARVQLVHRCRKIAEVQRGRLVSGTRADHGAGAHLAIGLENPARAAAVQIQRVHVAALRADKNCVVG